MALNMALRTNLQVCDIELQVLIWDKFLVLANEVLSKNTNPLYCQSTLRA
jgi:hypothetical protein